MTGDSPTGNGDPDEGPEDVDELLDRIHEHLAATQERPVERTASRWIGEAEAVADDLATASLADDVVHERLGHVRSLLAEVDDTGDEDADDHVERARSVTATAIDRLDAE